MPYRKQPLGQRKYLHIETEQNHTTNDGNTNLDERTFEIPLPNEIENASNEASVRQSNHIFSIFKNLINRIHMDDIILLGLIFLLLDENIEDDFLLIMLLYILIL